MLNIIKSIRYYLHRNILTWAYVLMVLAVYVYAVAMTLSETSVDEYTGAYAFRLMVEWNNIFIMVVAILFVPLICANDFPDKFINYELLEGYKKKHSYYARAMYSYVLVYAWFIISCFIPMIIGCLMNGYQSADLQVNDLFILLLSGFVMVFRFVSVVVFLSFLFENIVASCVVVYFLEVLTLFPSMLLGEIFEGLKKTYILSSGATYEKVMLPSDMVPGFVDGKDVYLPIYNFSENLGAVVGSFVFGAVLLTAGCFIYKSRDRK